MYKTHIKYFGFTPNEQYSLIKELKGNKVFYNGLSLKKDEWINNQNPIIKNCLKSYNVDSIVYMKDIKKFTVWGGQL